MKLLRAGEKGFEEYLSRIEKREGEGFSRIERTVGSILKDVRERGDRALVYYTQVFDKVRIPIRDLRVRREEIEQSYSRVPLEFTRTLEKAARRIRHFHRLGIKKSTSEFEKGIRLGRVFRPLERVGIYVPGARRLIRPRF